MIKKQANKNKIGKHKQRQANINTNRLLKHKGVHKYKRANINANILKWTQTG